MLMRLSEIVSDMTCCKTRRGTMFASVYHFCVVSAAEAILLCVSVRRSLVHLMFVLGFSVVMRCSICVGSVTAQWWVVCVAAVRWAGQAVGCPRMDRLLSAAISAAAAGRRPSWLCCNKYMNMVPPARTVSGVGDLLLTPDRLRP